MATSIAEYVLAARVVVVWDNSKWAFIVVAISLVCAVSSNLILFALDSSKYSQAKRIYLNGIFDICVIEGPCYAALWKMWVIILAYNTVLGLLVLIKAVITYKQKMTRGSLRYIVVQGSLQYYAIIIALSTGVLVIWDSADPVTLMAGSDLVIIVTIVLACRVILDLRRAYFKPVTKESLLVKSNLTPQSRGTLVLS